MAPAASVLARPTDHISGLAASAVSAVTPPPPAAPAAPPSTSTTFHVTGFGPFHGVPDNPSGRLVDALPDALARVPVAAAATLTPSSGAPSAGAPPPAVVLASHKVLTVSTVAVDAALTDLYGGLRRERSAAAAVVPTAAPPSRTVVIHFGVDARASCFHLEAVAVNEARFCVPDQANARPWGCAVVQEDDGDDDMPADGGGVDGSPSRPSLLTTALRVLAPRNSSQRRTRLPLDDVVRVLTAAGWPVSISHDAGRFVCNWTYYRSLAHVANLERSPAAASVAGGGVAGCEQSGTTAASVGTAMVGVGPGGAVETATVGVGPGGAVTAGGGSNGVGAPTPVETGVAATAHPPPPAAAHAAPPLTALFVHVPAVRSATDHGRYADFAAALLHALAAADWR